ncbi:HlyD family efflux transporter periplasmic adaptor subunit [Maricaulis maris]|uniref:HlyD family efflux transporter periplasmic adaptor subunit n=1 Tax=Maricaulis maris TaxID=74318 RepID=UPI0030C693CE
MFRQKALAQFNQRASGEPIAQLPVAWTWLASLIVLALVAASLFLVLNEYARKERAVGWLRYASGELALFAPMSGVVEELYVGEGDPVHGGDALYVIRAADTSMDGAELTEEYALSITQEIELIGAREQSMRSALAARMEESEAQIATLTAQLAAVDDQIGVARVRRVVLDGQYRAGIELAERGILAERMLEDRHVLALNQQETESALLARRAELAGALDVQRNRARQIPLDAEEQILTLSQARTQLERMLLEARLREGVLVSAPAGGRIAAKQVSAGGSVRVGERALTIVSSDSVLQAELYLPSRAMARIRPGQEVRIYYSAFPHRRYGVATGRIESVSTTVFRPEEIPTPLQLEEAAYRAVVTLDAQAIEAFGERFELRSGMTLNAEVILERQSLFEWLLEPLSSSA